MSAAFSMSRSGRAFSLIEVLIGVLILALGLLGLGAVIPVVVREQRAASDATLGVAVANSAQQYLTSLDGTDPQSSSVRLSIWDQFLYNRNWGYTNGGNSLRPEYYLWDLSPRLVFSNYWYPVGAQSTAPVLDRVKVDNMQYTFDPVSGAMTWSVDSYTRQHRASATRGQWLPVLSTDPARRSYTKIALSDRLWPSPQVRVQETITPGRDSYRPQFVWDFVARRVPPTTIDAVPSITTPAQLQVAVFVRRLDLNITLPPTPRPPNTMPVGKEYTLFAALGQDSLPAEQQLDRTAWRVPVADDAELLPTRAGIDSRSATTPLRYSTIKSATADIADTTKYPARDVLLITYNQQGANKPAILRLLSQPGQKLVDNLGNIYTVRGVPDPDVPPAQNQIEVVVDPPVAPSVLSPTDPIAMENQLNSNVIRQVLFTTQIPAAVRVFTISRPVIPASN